MSHTDVKPFSVISITLVVRLPPPHSGHESKDIETKVLQLAKHASSKTCQLKPHVDASLE